MFYEIYCLKSIYDYCSKINKNTININNIISNFISLELIRENCQSEFLTIFIDTIIPSQILLKIISLVVL